MASSRDGKIWVQQISDREGPKTAADKRQGIKERKSTANRRANQ